MTEKEKQPDKEQVAVIVENLFDKMLRKLVRRQERRNRLKRKSKKVK